MKVTNFLWLIFIATLLIADCNQGKKPEKTMTFQGTLDSLIGPEEETKLVRSFPYSWYKIYQIEDLGSFYLDQRVDIIKNALKKGEVREKPIVD
jgi:hypothetical protein